jgi:hypothetical protein
MKPDIQVLSSETSVPRVGFAPALATYQELAADCPACEIAAICSSSPQQRYLTSSSLFSFPLGGQIRQLDRRKVESVGEIRSLR